MPHSDSRSCVETEGLEQGTQARIYASACAGTCGAGFQPVRSSQVATSTPILRKYTLKIIVPVSGIVAPDLHICTVTLGCADESSSTVTPVQRTAVAQPLSAVGGEDRHRTAPRVMVLVID
jgi:hypothetical protein